MLALNRWHPPIHATKSHNADLVALPQRNVAEEQRGIKAMVELGKVHINRPHSPTAIQEEDERLVALLAIFAGDEQMPARSGLPVDLRKHIAILIIAELMKLAALARHVLAHDSHLACAITHREQRVAHDGFVIGIHLHRFLRTDAISALPKPERRSVAHVALRKNNRPALHRGRLIQHANHSSGRNSPIPRQMLARNGLRQSIEKLRIHRTPS